MLTHSFFEHGLLAYVSPVLFHDRPDPRCSLFEPGHHHFAVLAALHVPHNELLTVNMQQSYKPDLV